MNHFETAAKIATAMPTLGEQREAAEARRNDDIGRRQAAARKEQNDASAERTNKLQALSNQINQEHGIRTRAQAIVAKFVEVKTEAGQVEIDAEVNTLLGLATPATTAAAKSAIKAAGERGTQLKEQLHKAIAELKELQAKLPDLLAERQKLLREAGVL